MRPGRPSLREQFRRQILSALRSHPYPVTANTVKRLVDAQRSQPCGWDTAHKYLQELTTERLVLRQVLPAEKGRKPLVVYMGRSKVDQ